ncbi:hypothetical protein SAMN05216188_1313 [Lentzea xinjiangensis]|uniref:Uncharacterized protein n=1 Tax=Lentzea xinjiangensis TaxID=402600 RepID=A0A1H9W6Z4_9PSEU|nr:hypothetical protein [Lentzea xinjiangensis]SES29682.1 hypothetical protein SAMN05216188_1313 [Lentzea xinjiangensis]
MTSPGPAAQEPALPGPSVAGLDLATLDLRVELAAAGAELHHHLLRGDREVADLLGAWIDALLDEWNRRRG